MDSMRLVFGAVIGAAIGVVIGHIGQKQGGACPFLCHPVGGMLFGAAVGVLLATSLKRPSETVAKPSEHVIAVESEAQFDALLTSHPVALVDFYADWCGPCRMLKPTLHQLADELQGRPPVLTVDIDRHKGLAARYGVNSIPTVKLFAAGREQQSFTGVRRIEVYRDAARKAMEAAATPSTTGKP